jgi:hypothetical protein
MTARELLAALQCRGGVLRVEGGGLRLRAPVGAIPATLRAEASARKAELLALLRTAAPADGAYTPPAAPWDQTQADDLLAEALARRAKVFGHAGYPADQTARCHLARLADRIDAAWLARDMAGLRRAAADYLAAVAAGVGLAGMAPAGIHPGAKVGPARPG